MHNAAFVPTRNATQKNSLTSNQVEKVRIWRCKHIISNSNKKTTLIIFCNGSEKIGAAKGPSFDSEWEDNLILL